MVKVMMDVFVVLIVERVVILVDFVVTVWPAFVVLEAELK